MVCDVLGRTLIDLNKVQLKKGTNNIALQDLSLTATGICTVTVSFNSNRYILRIQNFRN
jgi:hypothetical protein